MDTVEIRLARDEEYEAVAELRWRWELEHTDAPDIAREEFTAHFAAWARAHADSHRCTVVAQEGALIGMAWLAVMRRVPTPQSLDRVCGDLQSVYLVPQERAKGLGGRLVAAVLEDARKLGMNQVTVHSSGRAVPVYARNGFAASPKLLMSEL
ncbi:MAG TPA: GNAT family N-acetyltransferase [Glycomyces sp.]|nr:GNAT family N-acetyltransferase [Glycomyces sp.]